MSEIIDNTNLQVHLLQIDVNEYLKQTISRQQEKIKSLRDANSHLNTVIITNEKRMRSKEYKDHFKLMLYFY
jgi:hypothetical protein